MMRLVL